MNQWYTGRLQRNEKGKRESIFKNKANQQNRAYSNCCLQLLISQTEVIECSLNEHLSQLLVSGVYQTCKKILNSYLSHTFSKSA